MTAQEAYNKTEDLLDGYACGDLHGGNPMQYIQEYAKFHVTEALKAAYENVDMDKEYYLSIQEGYSGDIDRDSILNAYPLTNIK